MRLELVMDERYADDIRLVDRILAGDQSAWAELATQHAVTLRYALIRSLARYGADRSEHVIEDLWGDVMLSLLAEGGRKLRTYGGRCSLRQWLKVVAGNAAIDHLRRSRPMVSLSTSAESGRGSIDIEAVVDRRPDPAEQMEEQERRVAIAELLAQLNDEDRLFVELYYARELSYEEVAEQMGTTLGAVYTRRNRIRKRLTTLAREAALI